MKTKILTGLALVASILIGQPVYAHSDHGGGKGGGHARVASSHHGGGGGGGKHEMRVASVSHRGGGGGKHNNVAFGGAVRESKHGDHVAAGRTFTAPVERGLATNNNRNINRGGRHENIALAGSSVNNRNDLRNFRGSGRGNYQFAFASHDGWRHDRDYEWNGHHYRWINNGWFIIDPWLYPDTYGYGYTYGPSYYDSDSAAVQVQQDLAHDGYYNGPIDGVVGPGTRAAIANYQRDNNLPITGTISLSLLDSLNGG